jgi:DNA-directed RNA polymerase specialized sigma24 family protein
VTTSVRRAAAGGDGPIVRRVLQPEVLEDFHKQFFMPLVRRATWKHGLSKEDARDVVQEAFLLALVKLDPDGNPKAWLISVVDRLAIGLVRKTARRARLASRWGLGPDGGGGSEDPLTDCDIGERE